MGGYYQQPSADGSRPGRYFVAAGDRRYGFDIATTAYHETLPGHHLQIARALEADIPGFLKAPGVHAEVAVCRSEKAPQLRE